MSKYSKDDIQKAIIAKYGSQKASADKMGKSENALSNQIKRASDKFVKELEVKYGSDIKENNRDEENKINERFNKMEQRIADLEQQNKFLVNMTAKALEQMEEKGIENQSLRVQFFTFLKNITEGSGEITTQNGD